MIFFSINSGVCRGCNRCFKACPAQAIEVSGKNRRIIYDKCVACGKCFKECPEHAVVLDIPVERIREMQEEIGRIETYKKQIERLEAENTRLREDRQETGDELRLLIRKLPVAAALVERSGRVRHINNRFIGLLDFGARQLCDTVPGLIGAPFEELVPEPVARLFRSAIREGADAEGVDLEAGGDRKLVVSAYSIKKGELALVLIRDLYEKELMKEEVIDRIYRVIDRNMAMVQKIGFLLGEEASETTRILNSVIRSVK